MAWSDADKVWSFFGAICKAASESNLQDYWRLLLEMAVREAQQQITDKVRSIGYTSAQAATVDGVQDKHTRHAAYLMSVWGRAKVADTDSAALEKLNETAWIGSLSVPLWLDGVETDLEDEDDLPVGLLAVREAHDADPPKW